MADPELLGPPPDSVPPKPDGTTADSELELIYQGSPMGLALFDLDLRYVRINQKLAEINGHEPAEIIGRTLREILPDLADELEPILRRVIETGQPIFDGAATGVTAAAPGRERVFRHSYQAVRGIDGRIEGVSVVVAELTELKHAEADFRNIFDNSPHGIVVADTGGVLLRWNTAFAKLLGYDHSDLHGRTVGDITHPDDLAQTKIELDKLAAGSVDVVSLEKRYVRGDGQVLVAMTDVTTLQSANEPELEFLALVHDITKRKRAEAELAGTRAELEERNLELQGAVRELRSAREEAMAASTAKGQFLANMSHEIRTPMSGVLGVASLLSDTELNEEQRELVGLIGQSGEALMTVINDILDFSKIEAGRLSIEPVPFDFRVAVQTVADQLGARASEKNIKLLVDFPPDCPRHVVGDAGRVRQIVMNLMENAVKFTEEGYVKLTVEYTAVSSDKTEFRVEVEDSGIGIPSDRIPRLFERFTQADASTTRRWGGTGLGLSISSQLVELMGGEIGAENRTDVRGARFWFTVALPMDLDRHSTPLEADLEGVRVLVVDDGAVSRKVVSDLVSTWGMEGHAVATAEAALTTLLTAEDDPYEIVIIDLRMPGVDGVELAHALKALPPLRSLVLVGLFEFGQRGDAERAKGAGFAAYLSKPVNASELFDTLTAVWKAYAEGKRTEIVTRHSIAQHRAPRVGPSTRVLVAEDSHVNQIVAKNLLEKLGCHVDIAQNGREAVDMLLQSPYEVVFMDCQMPGMDGFEATAEIRANQDLTEMPIIAMTANAMTGDRERCLAAGMNDYIAKPVDSGHLQDVLKKWSTDRGTKGI